MKNIALALLAVGFMLLSRWNSGDKMSNAKGLLLDCVSFAAAIATFIV